MSKLFLRDYQNTHLSMMNCLQNVEERTILSLQEETMTDFDYYDEYFNKYIKRNVVMIMLRKAILQTDEKPLK